MQHGKTLGKVFFANLLINAADQPEALKVVEIILGKNCNTAKKWNVQSSLKKLKVAISFPEKSPPHLCKCAYFWKYPKSIIQFYWILLFQQQSVHTSEYVGDLSSRRRKVKNIFLVLKWMSRLGWKMEVYSNTSQIFRIHPYHGREIDEENCKAIVFTVKDGSQRVKLVSLRSLLDTWQEVFCSKVLNIDKDVWGSGNALTYDNYCMSCPELHWWCFSDLERLSENKQAHKHGC